MRFRPNADSAPQGVAQLRGGRVADPAADDEDQILEARMKLENVLNPVTLIDSYFPNETDPAIIGLDKDPDGDGIDNGVENFFGTRPDQFNQGLQADDVTGNQFTFTHPVGEDPASDLTATYRWSKDSVTFTPSGGSHNGTTVTITPGTPTGGFVTVTAVVSGTSTSRLFVDVQVTQP